MNWRSTAKSNTASSFTPVLTGLLQRKCESCGQHTIAGGECTDCAKKRSVLQRKLAISASNDPLEREADLIAEAIVNSSHAIQPVTATGANPVVQRQPDDVQKPRDQPSTFPVGEQPKVGQEREDAEKEKLKKGALKAASEFAQLLWENFSASQTGMHVLAQNEHDWQAIIKFFEDFADTAFGKIALGASAGGAATGAFLGASSARDKSVVPDPSSGGANVSRAPKDEKFFALELKWDFISSPSGVTIKTPWLDSPKLGGGSKSNTPMTLPPAPQLIKPMLKVPKICTPADPSGDHGEANARSAQIYSWLLWKQQQDADKMNELLRKYMQPIQAPGEIWRPGEPYTFKQSQVSTIKPLFKRSDGTTEVADPQAIDAGLHSSAQSLDPTTQSDMEMRFGHDFSRVRVHTSQAADKSAKAVNALAYTVGTHVVFRSGQYAPATKEGRRLLAHELTHVVQQQNATPHIPQFLGGNEYETAEIEANHSESRIVGGATSSSVLTQPNLLLQRKVNVDKPKDLIDNPTGKGLVQTNAQTVEGYLQTLCSGGTVSVNKGSGSVNLDAAFCPTLMPMGFAGPPAPAPADKSKEPTGCNCLCDMVGSTNDYKIVVDDKDWPHTSGRVVTTPSPNSPKFWGTATVSGKAMAIDPWLVLGHEFCGHAWLAEKGLPDENATRGEGGHQETVGRENKLRKEHGIEARGSFKDPYCGESFSQDKSGPGPVEWSSFLKKCEAWRKKTYGGKYKISDKIP